MTTMTDDRDFDRARRSARDRRPARCARWRARRRLRRLDRAAVSAANRRTTSPGCPPETIFRIEMEGSAGSDPPSDVVLAEVDGSSSRRPASSGSSGTGTPILRDLGQRRSRRTGDAVSGRALLPRTCPARATRAAAEDRRTPSRRPDAFDETEVGHRALLEGGRLRRPSATSSSCTADLDDIPDAPLPDGHRAPAGHRRPAPGDLRRRGRRPSGITGAAASRRRRLPDHLRPTRSSTPGCGSSPGTATRSRVSSRTGSGPRRTRRSVSSAAGSSTSASAGRGVAAASPGRSPRSRCGGSGRPGMRRGDARRRFGEPDRRARALRGSRLRGPSPVDAYRRSLRADARGGLAAPVRRRWISTPVARWSDRKEVRPCAPT